MHFVRTLSVVVAAAGLLVAVAIAADASEPFTTRRSLAKLRAAAAEHLRQQRAFLARSRAYWLAHATDPACDVYRAPEVQQQQQPRGQRRRPPRLLCLPLQHSEDAYAQAKRAERALHDALLKLPARMTAPELAELSAATTRNTAVAECLSTGLPEQRVAVSPEVSTCLFSV